MKPLVSISIIHFSLKDGFTVKHHLKPFFESILAQTYRNVEIFVVDNASTDEEAKQMLRDLPGIEIIWLKENRGTCAHNAVLDRAKGSYLWCVTMDTRYEPDFLEQLVAQAEKLPRGGAFGGSLLYLDQEQKTERIDSLGTGINRFHSFWDRHHGEPYHQEDFPAVEEVFGISGATVLYRMEALKDIALQNGTVWDEPFFMYYEDVDVCYRMQWRGWRSYVIHAARGWHVRTLAEKQVRGGRIVRILLSRGKKSDFHRYYANRNKIWLLYRNFSREFSVSTKVASSLELIGRLAWLMLFEPASRKAVREAWTSRHFLERPLALPDEKTAVKRIEAFMHS